MRLLAGVKLVTLACALFTHIRCARTFTFTCTSCPMVSVDVPRSLFTHTHEHTLGFILLVSYPFDLHRNCRLTKLNHCLILFVFVLFCFRVSLFFAEQPKETKIHSRVGASQLNGNVSHVNHVNLFMLMLFVVQHSE